MANIGYGDGLFYKEKVIGYVENGYIKEIGNRNMDNIYFYSSEYLLDNSMIEIYGKHNKIDEISKKSKIPVCQILALLNCNIERKLVD
jgi:alanine racemase